MTIRWNLTGTPRQRGIALEAFSRIKFPFDRLTQLPGTPELGWRDLNNSTGWMYESKARFHGANSHGKDKPHTLEDARRRTLGVIFTMSGRIFLDVSLESDPELAMQVLGMEAFHAVDIFMPMTDDQRGELMRMWGKGGTWWEVSDYGREYFTLGGEAFMYEGLGAYSDFDLGANPFMHNEGVEPADVRRILGIERTDTKPPFVRYGKSNVYHLADHYESRTGIPVSTLDGMRPCKVCKP